MVGLLLLISTEIALRGELMRLSWAGISTEQLAQFNHIGLCLGDPGTKQPGNSEHSSAHCLLCFLHIIPAAQPPVSGAFANLIYFKLLAVQAALIRETFLETVSARGPPR